MAELFAYYLPRTKAEVSGLLRGYSIEACTRTVGHVNYFAQPRLQPVPAASYRPVLCFA